MSTRQERVYMKQAQKISRRLELACEDDLFAWFEGSHIGTHGEDDKPRNGHRELEEAVAIFGDCPCTELEYDAKKRVAYIWVGCGKARVPNNAMNELHDFFDNLHNC